MSKTPHNDIIKKAAEEILVPLGMFQKGQSRCWFDDNGWFMTQVEFQPSMYGTKGAYLNVGMCFLWETTSADDDLFFDVGHREKAYEEYLGDDDDFYRRIVKMTEHAKEKILYYRKFTDLKFCRKHLKSSSSELVLVGDWNMAMFRFFTGDMSGRRFLQKIAERNFVDPDVEWSNRLTPKSKELLTMDDEYLTYYVRDSIRTRRALIMKKAGFKKLKKWEMP